MNVVECSIAGRNDWSKVMTQMKSEDEGYVVVAKRWSGGVRLHTRYAPLGRILVPRNMRYHAFSLDHE
jgi:hypothetical protein